MNKYDDAQTYLNPNSVGSPSEALKLRPGATLVAAGIAPVGDASTLSGAAIGVELGLAGSADGSVKWFSAGDSFNMNSSTTTRAIPVSGYSHIRFVVATADSTANLIAIYYGVV